MKKKRIILSAMAALAMAVSAPEATACSRILYAGNDSLRIVGRSLDWRTPIPTNIYVYPRGMEKQGNTLPGSVTWKSRYGAVYAVSYDGGVTEGMNEKGLVVNGLFCVGSVYENDSTKGRAPMSLAMFPAWILDMNATTPEVVELMRKHDFNLTGAQFDGGTTSALHWAVTDAQGRSAIIEFDKGHINVYEGQDMAVLTNDPPYPQMTAINDYWKKVDRDASYRQRSLLCTCIGFWGSPSHRCRSVFTRHPMIVGTVSVPYTYTVESEKNESPHQWSVSFFK